MANLANNVTDTKQPNLAADSSRPRVVNTQKTEKTEIKAETMPAQPLTPAVFTSPRPNIPSLPGLVNRPTPVVPAVGRPEAIAAVATVSNAVPRPLSPRDTTEISVHGVPLDRSLVKPIVPVADTTVIRPASPVAVLAMPKVEVRSEVKNEVKVRTTSPRRESHSRLPSVTQRNAAGLRQPVPFVANASASSNVGTFSPPARQVYEPQQVHSPKPSESREMVRVENPNTLPAPRIPDYGSMSPEVQAQHFANFVSKYGILREAWPNYHIPAITPDMTLTQIHAGYDIYVRHIFISNDADKFKLFMIIGWLFIELVGSKLNLNIGGYTVTQMKSMNKYEKLLVELGESNYQQSLTANSRSDWPVEMRLLFVSLVNAVTFIIIKMLASYMGEGIATTVIDGLASYFTGSPPQTGQALFGSVPANPPNSGAPGPSDLPPIGAAANPFGGMDVGSLMANLGDMFINGRGLFAPRAGSGASSSAAASTSAPAPATAPSGTTRFSPKYEE